jgi:hypothetical protein
MSMVTLWAVRAFRRDIDMIVERDKHIAKLERMTPLERVLWDEGYYQGMKGYEKGNEKWN